MLPHTNLIQITVIKDSRNILIIDLFCFIEKLGRCTLLAVDSLEKKIREEI